MTTRSGKEYQPKGMNLEELQQQIAELVKAQANLLAENESLKAAVSKIESTEVVKETNTSLKDTKISRETLRALAASVPTFKGTRSATETLEFLAKTTIFFKFDTSNIEAKLAFVVQKFSGKASLWFNVLQNRIKNKEIPDVKTWEEFSDLIKEEFISPEYQQNILQKLSQLKQTSSVSLFIETFENLMLQLPMIPDLVSQGYFLAGLKQNIAGHITNNSSNLENLESVKRAALRFDELNNQQKGGNVFSGFIKDSMKDKLPSKGNTKESGKPKQERFCTFCDRPGHDTKKCWKAKRKIKNKEMSNNAEDATDNERETRVLSAVYGSITSDTLDEVSYKKSSELEIRFVLDSGCTHHMVNNRMMFTKLEAKDGVVSVANGASIPICGIGEIHAETIEGKKIILTHVLFVPKLRLCLLSVSSLLEKKCMVKFCTNEIVISEMDGTPILYATKENNLFHLNINLRNNIQESANCFCGY